MSRHLRHRLFHDPIIVINLLSDHNIVIICLKWTHYCYQFVLSDRRKFYLIYRRERKIVSGGEMSGEARNVDFASTANLLQHRLERRVQQTGVQTISEMHFKILSHQKLLRQFRTNQMLHLLTQSKTNHPFLRPILFVLQYLVCMS